MAGFVNLVSSRFGRLIVLNRAPNQGRRVAWNCQCDCGNTCLVISDSLRSKDTQSCGCLRREVARTGNSSRTHGGRNTPEYKSWDSAKQRCFNTEDKGYTNYGGRGITMCERWLDFGKFLADIGPRPSRAHTLDRIDVNGPYAPENCRWATWDEQNNNQRRNHRLEHNGRTLTMSQWAKELGVNYSTFKWYIYRGMTLAHIAELVQS